MVRKRGRNITYNLKGNKVKSKSNALIESLHVINGWSYKGPFVVSDEQ